MRMDAKRIYGLDYMRGFACLLVVFYHYTTRFCELFPEYQENWVVQVPFGYMGVCVFFLLSGYLSLRQFKEGTTLLSYAISKGKRLYPCYWIAVVLTYAVSRFFLVERAVSVKEFLLNLTMLESFLGVTPVDGAYWTLANELIFYVFIALLFIVLKRKALFSYAALLWLVAANGIQSMPNEGLIYSAANKLLMTQYAHMFLAGGFIFCFFQSEKTFDRGVNLVGWVLCQTTQFRIHPSDYGVFFLGANLLLVCSILCSKNNRQPNRLIQTVLYPLTFLSSISYPLYLLHQNIGYAMLRGIYNAGIRSELIILIPTAALILLSYMMHRFVEVPIIKKKTWR